MAIEILEVKPRSATIRVLTLAEIKRKIAPVVSKWARKIDWHHWDKRFSDGEIGWCPTKGSARWLRIRSDKKRHAFSFVCDNETHYEEVARFAAAMEKAIEEEFGQVVPIDVVRNWGVVTSGERSATVFRGEELGDGIPF